jgi:hypothetical protein
MDPTCAYHDNTDMQDVHNHYDEVGQAGQGPYFNMQNLDPRLSGLIDHDMANIHLGGADGVSPTREMSSEVLTPSQSKSAMRPKKGKKAQVAHAKGPDSEQTSEEDEEDEEEDEEEEEEEEEDDFESEDEEDYEEPVVRKKHRSATKLKLSTPKSHKGTPKSSARSSKTTRRSTGTKVNDALPFNRQRRAPKNGITDSRPIPRSYDECDEADKALLDMRDKENKTWKEIRAMWEELTGQKTGTSTLPNRYE